MQSKLFLIYLRHTHYKIIVQIVNLNVVLYITVSKKEGISETPIHQKYVVFAITPIYMFLLCFIDS